MKINNIIIHHGGGIDSDPLLDSSNYTVFQCDRDHKDRFNMKSSLGWWVGYHYFIDKHGDVTQTRRDDEEGAHCVGYNNHFGDNPSKRSIGICLSGNFDATLPTEAQKQALARLLKEKVAQYNIPLANIVPHRKYAIKTCYGRKLSDSWARDLVLNPLPDTTPMRQCSLGESGPHIQAVQDTLKKHNFIVSQMKSGVYNEDMAENVLYFQMSQNIQKESDVAILRGERIGPATLQALNKLK